MGKTEGKRPRGRPRRRWVDNIRMDLQEVGCGYVDWIVLAQDRDRWRTLVSAVMNLRVPWSAWNFLTSCKPVSCSRRTLHHGLRSNNNNNNIISKHISQDRFLSQTLQLILYIPLTDFVVRGGEVDWGTVLQAGRSSVRFSLVSLKLYIDIRYTSFWLH